MRKDQQEELRRLEEALMEMDQPEPEEDADQWLEDFYYVPEEDYAEPYDVYNTDEAEMCMVVANPVDVLCRSCCF